MFEGHDTTASGKCHKLMPLSLIDIQTLNNGRANKAIETAYAIKMKYKLFIGWGGYTINLSLYLLSLSPRYCLGPVQPGQVPRTPGEVPRGSGRHLWSEGNHWVGGPEVSGLPQVLHQGEPEALPSCGRRWTHTGPTHGDWRACNAQGHICYCHDLCSTPQPWCVGEPWCMLLMHKHFLSIHLVSSFIIL